jgi:branched-chain amino acid transport system ATP-binding protein
MLEVRGLHVHYGLVHAIKGVDVSIHSGQTVCLIGANGAGKTTLLNTLSGIVKPSGGTISFGGEEIAGLPPQRIVAMGIVQVPEGRQIFHDLTVVENLEMGAYLRLCKGENIKGELEEIWNLFPVLGQRKGQMAGTLSGGEQQMLALARGLMSKPKLMMLDEPSLGLAPLVAAEIFKVIRMLPRRNTTVLLVEQNAKAALKVSDKGYVMETGRIVLSGDANFLKDNEDVKRAFLGETRED